MPQGCLFCDGQMPDAAPVVVEDVADVLCRPCAALLAEPYCPACHAADHAPAVCPSLTLTGVG